jgi:hypothetical protein
MRKLERAPSRVEGSVGTRVSRGMPAAALAGDSERPPSDMGPSNPGVDVLRTLGRTGRSKPGSSRRGELAPEGTRAAMVPRGGGSRASSSAMVPKRSLMLLARERVLRRSRGAPRPLTGDSVPERFCGVGPVLARCQFGFPAGSVCEITYDGQSRLSCIRTSRHRS